MNSQEIHLSRKITTQLLHLAQLSPTQEICGLIGSANNTATSCYSIDNTAENPKNRFQMDEQQQINAFSTMRDRNETLFAIYHSHPTAPAIPSQTDLAQSAYPDALYLIISLNTKGVLELRGFKINQNKVTDIPLCLIE